VKRSVFQAKHHQFAKAAGRFNWFQLWLIKIVWLLITG